MDVGSVPRPIPGRGGACVGLLATVAFTRATQAGTQGICDPCGMHLGVIALIFVLFFGHRYESNTSEAPEQRDAHGLC